MKQILILIFIILLFSCKKIDRIDHEDEKYIYVWHYENNDSVLIRYKQPEIVEYNVMGGHHRKAHHIKVDFNKNGNYECHSISADDYVYSNRYCDIVDKAKYAYNINQPIVGIFKEYYYPKHKYNFIKYK